MYADTQNDMTRQVVHAAQLLLAYGVGSDLVEEISQRLGQALGLASVALSISSHSLVLTSLVHGRCITTTRRIREHGINMTVVCELKRICLLAEKGLYGPNEVRKRLARIEPKTYPPSLVVFMIGLSCASFCHLFNGDLTACVITFFAAAVGMPVRLAMAKRHVNLLVNFAITAFVTSMLAQTGYLFELSETPKAAMAVSVLMLVSPLMYAVGVIMPMILGTNAFSTVIALVQLTAQSQVSPELTGQVISNGLKTVFILGALAVAMPSLLYFRTRPVIQ